MSRSSGESGHDEFHGFDKEEFEDSSTTPSLELDLSRVPRGLSTRCGVFASQCFPSGGGRCCRARSEEISPVGCVGLRGRRRKRGGRRRGGRMRRGRRNSDSAGDHFIREGEEEENNKADNVTVSIPFP